MTEAADIEAQAAAWIARADARGSDQDPQLEAWLIADPRHRAAYVRLAHAWERTQRLARLRPAAGAIDPDLLAPSRPGALRTRLRRRASTEKASRPRPMRWVAMAVGIAAAVFLAAWNLLPSSSTESYRTSADGLSRVFLTDGSVVTMNANTVLRVHFTAARRNVTLLRGEAHFSVTHDTHRPFEVHAGTRIVVAVGTAFDVRLEPGRDVEVTVTEGRVALLEDGPQQPRMGEPPLQTISAGQDALLTMQRMTVQRLDPAEIFQRLKWERRELSFDGQTLSQAVAEFDRYTNHKIVIDDPSIASIEVGGTFRALDAGSFVAALDRAFGIASRASARGTIHLFRVGDAKAARLHL
ncbi:MAG TPA: FecR domain-containing protein [Steroidobacteraceae bacterium]|nr:FecR domain-containing protein [Steroidobacteraceae bacterium]